MYCLVHIMKTARLNITLPETLIKELNKLAGPRKKSHFIAQSLYDQIKTLHQTELQKSLKTGYQAQKKEAVEITQAFESTDLENWDDY